MSKIIKWFETVTGEDSVNAAASRAKISQSTLARQLKTGTLTPEMVVAVARAYDTDPIEGLLAVGLITEDDLRYSSREVLLRELSDEDIADEVWRRLQRGTAAEPITGGQPNLIVIEGDIAAKTDPRWGDETDQ